MIHPITFSIPASKVLPEPIQKIKVFAQINPNDRSTYTFTSESDYYTDYARSIFGRTQCKGGWDCLRHYEILASGCIPWFKDLASCPPKTMTMFPKELVMQAMAALGNEHDCNSAAVKEWSKRLLDYTRVYLTTKAMAAHTLGHMKKPKIRKILFLSGDSNPDYMRCLLLHGLKEIYGKECHDFPCIPHLYTDYPSHQAINLYGKGITYSRLLNKADYHAPVQEFIIEDRIATHEYDIIIYGSIHRGMPYWDLVHKFYKPEDIALVCGEDLHQCKLQSLGIDHHLFIREQ